MGVLPVRQGSSTSADLSLTRDTSTDSLSHGQDNERLAHGTLPKVLPLSTKEWIRWISSGE